jgi:hypothetical protein
MPPWWNPEDGLCSARTPRAGTCSLLGLVAGYYQRWVGPVVMWLADVRLAVLRRHLSSVPAPVGAALRQAVDPRLKSER